MAWIFQGCRDVYGNCIRQYTVFAITIIVLIICLISIYKTLKKQNHYNFQNIPLLINGIATFAILCTQTQLQQQNIYLIMLVIQIYSYFLLTYSYVGLYLLGTKRISKHNFRKIRGIFIVFSVLVLVGIALLIILQIFIKIKCQESHGFGNLILSLMQLPLYIISFIYVIKTKNHIGQMQTINHQDDNTQIKLLDQEDDYIRIRYNQANLMIVSFTLSILLHAATVVMFFIAKTSCQDGKYISTQNLYEVVMFSLFDIATILPHIMIPTILYLIPAYYDEVGDAVVITPIKITNKDTNNDTGQYLVLQSDYESAEKIRQMAIKHSPQIKPKSLQFSS